MSFHFSIHETGKAFAALSPDEHAILENYAAQQIGGTSFAEPKDLVQETITRALEGTRRWPKHVHFRLFMCLTMKSVAEGDRSRNENKFTVPVSADEFVDRPSLLQQETYSIEDRLIAYERLWQASRAVELARAALRVDEHAQRAIDALIVGFAPREARAAFLMDESEFDAARHRAARRLREAGKAVEVGQENLRFLKFDSTVRKMRRGDLDAWRQASNIEREHDSARSGSDAVATPPIAKPSV
ncbi:hypothetical protein [Paraburkholderia sp. GAS82]|uniref:hypothetical protein n=1 Tax=Paraburkholderia sp. GAS82 TaxID=3035137 RepID=UPI003D1AA751